MKIDIHNKKNNKQDSGQAKYVAIAQYAMLVEKGIA